MSSVLHLEVNLKRRKDNERILPFQRIVKRRLMMREHVNHCNSNQTRETVWSGQEGWSSLDTLIPTECGRERDRPKQKEREREKKKKKRAKT